MTRSARVYNNYIESDFFNTNTLGDFVRKFQAQTTEFDDDITLIHMKRVEFTKAPELDLVLESNRVEIAKAQEVVDVVIGDIIKSSKQSIMLSMAVNELIMNAFEHGNLMISGHQKQSLMMEDRYDTFVDQLEQIPQNLQKRILISIILSCEMSNGDKLLKISISDSGEGFDFTEVIKQARSPYNLEFRGRGIKMSLDSVGGLYYNSKGKKVTILETIKGEGLQCR